MITIRQTDACEKWFRKLRDREAKARILISIKLLSANNPGDVHSVGGGISELRIDYGPGYRVYFCRVDGAMAVLCWEVTRTPRDRTSKKPVILHRS